MPIKFSCPKCQNVMTVPDKMAGKKGKCKCGQVVQVPAAQPAADTGSQSLAGVFDDLTESDFQRVSPFEKVYSPPKQENDSVKLRQFESEDEQKKRKQSGKLTGMLVFLAVLNFLEGIACVAFAVLVFVAKEIIKKMGEVLPVFDLGANLLVAFLFISAIVLIAGGVGLLLKQKWGWIMVAMVWVVTVIERVTGLIMVCVNGFNQGEFFGAMIPMFVAFGLTSYLFKGETQQVYKISGRGPTIIAVVLGTAIAGGLLGAVFGLASQGG